MLPYKQFVEYDLVPHNYSRFSWGASYEPASTLFENEGGLWA
jgi:hypothetical protein